MRANRRSGTACTKTKGEVASGRKPWRQKGTGRARAGDKASPIWVGGGVVFGPRPRSYSKNTPKKVKVLAFRKALSERILAGDVLARGHFRRQGSQDQAVHLPRRRHREGRPQDARRRQPFDETTYLAARNVQTRSLATASDVNTEQLLAFDKIIVTADALATISERLSK